MTLLKQVSEAIGRSGKPFLNFYIAWRGKNGVHFTRIKPQFPREFGYLKANSVEVPPGEPFDKYVD